MRVWKVITDLNPDESDFLEDIFSYEDQEILRGIAEGEMVYNWDFIDGDVFIPYIICSETVIEALSEMCDKCGIAFGPIDITEEFLMGLHEIPDSDFEEYRINNLTEDIIYSKVKKFGGRSLDWLDKRILENG